MYMRLAFSVAVNVDPDILVIDEALAVGDGHFQKKCVDKIREFQEQGRTILFCSHALYYITTICSRTLWLDRGTMRSIGPSLDVVHEYETFLMEQDRVIKAAEDVEHPQEDIDVSPVRITEAVVENRFGEPATSFRPGDDVHLHLWIESDIPSQAIHLMVGVLRAADEMQCFAVGTHQDGVPPISGRHRYEMFIRLEKVPLLRGDYAVVIYAGDEAAIHVFDRKDIRPAFSMEGDRFEVGLITVQHSWEEIAPRVAARVR